VVFDDLMGNSDLSGDEFDVSDDLESLGLDGDLGDSNSQNSDQSDVSDDNSVNMNDSSVNNQSNLICLSVLSEVKDSLLNDSLKDLGVFLGLLDDDSDSVFLG